MGVDGMTEMAKPPNHQMKDGTTRDGCESSASRTSRAGNNTKGVLMDMVQEEMTKTHSSIINHPIHPIHPIHPAAQPILHMNSSKHQHHNRARNGDARSRASQAER